MFGFETVWHRVDESNAVMVASRLEENGICAYVQGPRGAGPLAEGIAYGGYDVSVDSQSAARARQLLEGYGRGAVVGPNPLMRNPRAANVVAHWTMGVSVIVLVVFVIVVLATR